jgi:hypothetical protein
MSLRASCVVSPVYILKSLLEPRTRPSAASLGEGTREEEKRGKEEEEEEDQHTQAKGAYVNIRQNEHTSAYGGIRRRQLRGGTIVVLELRMRPYASSVCGLKALLSLYTPTRRGGICRLVCGLKALLRLYTPTRRGGICRLVCGLKALLRLYTPTRRGGICRLQLGGVRIVVLELRRVARSGKRPCCC